MAAIKPLEYLYAGIYSAPCGFANLERFIDDVSEFGRLESEFDWNRARRTADEAAGCIADIAERIRPDGDIATEEAAGRLLCAEELTRLAEIDVDEELLAVPVGDRLRHDVEPIRARLKAIGIDVDDVPVRVVDAFPEPFHRFAWSAFAPDLEDEQRYGVARGVYFRRDKLRPLYTEALFAHEIIHTVTGRIDPEVYAVGLEEGVAEVVGACYAGLAVLPYQAILSTMIHGRHGCARPKLWSVYLDHTRQAFLLLREFGLAGLAELLRAGRAAIHEAEKAVVAGAYRSLPLPRGDFDPDTIRLAEAVCCAYPPSHVFSPLEYVLVRQARSGESVDAVCQQAGVPAEVGRPILADLGARSALFVQAGAEIGYSNVERYLDLENEANLPLIRYLPNRRD